MDEFFTMDELNEAVAGLRRHTDLVQRSEAIIQGILQHP